MELTNKYGLPQPVVKALTRDNYSRGKSNRSVTQLIDSPRVRILRKEHDHQLTEDVSEKLWAVLGQAVHRMFEDATDENHTSEERLFLDIEGWTISGAIDLQKKDDGTIVLTDYKTTSVWAVIFGKVEWQYQLNSYASLVRRAKGEKVTGLKVIAIMRDWSARDAEFKSDYPKAPILEIDVPLWTEGEQDAYLDGRVRIHQQAEFDRLIGSELPECSDEERWAKKPSWAVMKKGGKRAFKVFDNPEGAHALAAEKGKDYEVVFRRGENTRCEADWCRVSSFCSQFKRLSENN